MKKILVFSHESDIDGMGAVVLGKVAFGDIQYELFPGVLELESKFREYIVSNEFDKYDKIFISDLALYEPALSMVLESDLKDKVLVFDHHQTAIDKGYGDYPFTKIIEEDASGKRCGTELFYEYLVNNKCINRSSCIDTFVEYTRLEDTGDWKDNQDGWKAHELATLFNCIGINKYIDTMTDKLKNSLEFFFTSTEEKLIENKILEYNKILNNIMNSIEYFVDEDDNYFGVVFCDYQYRNEVTEYIEREGNPHDIKYVIMIAYDKGQYGQRSYRRIDDSVDVGKIALEHGGGGHPGGAGANITLEQREKALTMDRRSAAEFLANAVFYK